MDAKHTQGPWEQGKRHPGRVIARGAHKFIATCTRHQDDDDMPHDEERANAQLIAAAPEMLEALKDARRMLETASRYFPKSIKHADRFSLCNVLANSVNKAIRKAEGEL